jgi:acyl-coenzyme A thioesterase PaaI-like protein
MKVVYEDAAPGCVARVSPPGHFQGFHGVMHGGIVAGLMDDAMWHAIYFQGTITMTVELTVRYKAPVPVLQPLIIEGWIASKHRSLYLCEGVIKDESGSVLAEASGKFLPARGAALERLKASL